MGREIRKVHPDWQHPRDARGRYVPLCDGAALANSQAQWDRHEAAYLAGEEGEWAEDHLAAGTPWSELDGPRPMAHEYMPVWAEEEATKLMLYETTTEGTPWSDRKFDTIEQVAEWAAENATTFADYRASAEEWLAMLQQDFVHHDTGRGIVFM